LLSGRSFCGPTTPPPPLSRLFSFPSTNPQVKEILGTCVSVGCTVDGEDPRDIQAKIDEGEVDVPEE
jgi:hypothetical protein